MSKHFHLPFLILSFGSLAIAQELPPPPGIDPGPPPNVIPSPPRPQVTAPFNERLPASGRLAEGQTLVLRVISSVDPATTFQWYKDGLPIPGRTGLSMTIDAATAADAGSYQVARSLTGNTTLTEQRELSVFPPSRFANLSTRAESRSGDGILISGFVIAGNGTKPMLLRAVAPTLAREPFNVAGTLPNPRLKLFSGSTLLETWDDWTAFAEPSRLSSVTQATGAFPLDPAASGDAAAVRNFQPGSYTIHVDDTEQRTGVALLELYDGSSASSGTGSELVNLSSRAYVGTGDSVLIPGVVIAGDAPQRMLVRAVGPSLADFEVEGFLADPQFTLFRGSEPVGGNNDWIEFNDQAELAEQTNLTGAFVLQPGNRDAAAIFTLEPGIYTVVVSGVGGGSGQALVELYRLTN